MHNTHVSLQHELKHTDQKHDYYAILTKKIKIPPTKNHLMLPVGLQTDLRAVVPLAERAATRGRVRLWRGWERTLRFGLVLV